MLASSSDVAGEDVGTMGACAMLIEVRKTDANEVDFTFCVRGGTYTYTRTRVQNVMCYI